MKHGMAADANWQSLLSSGADLLRDSLPMANLSKLMKEVNRWAVIGGSVRDSLLTLNADRVLACGRTSQRSEPSGSSLKRVVYADIDVAVIDGDVSSVARVDGITYEKNSFGGFKIFDPGLGIVDMWAWPCTKRPLSGVDWVSVLSQVDFELNAVAYVFPEQRIVTHPRFRSSLGDLAVRPLAGGMGGRAIDLVRSVALANKVSVIGRRQTLTCSDVSLSYAKSELNWLLVQASESEVTSALCYLQRKIECRRWPREVGLVFHQLVAAIEDRHWSRAFREAWAFAEETRKKTALDPGSRIRTQGAKGTENPSGRAQHA